MNKLNTSLAVACTLVVLVGTAGCSSDGKKPIADYEKAVSPKPLDVPPDLSSPQINPAMDVPEAGGHAQSALLPRPHNVRVGRDGDIRWLEVDAAPEDVWAQVKTFFAKQGLQLKVEKPQVGILETGWLENRADIPEGFIRSLISKVTPGAYSAPTRDKFRVRLERGSAPNTTEVYLSHYGVQEVVKGDSTLWEDRPADPELTNEMLKRLLVYLGVPSVQATGLVEQAPKPPLRAHLDGQTLVVDESFVRAWRLVGIGLDRVGLLVEDRDRSQGVYFVRYTDQLAEATGDKQGWFSGLFSDEKQKTPREYRIHVAGAGDATRVTIEPVKPASNSPKRIQAMLTRLRDELH